MRNNYSIYSQQNSVMNEMIDGSIKLHYAPKIL